LMFCQRSYQDFNCLHLINMVSKAEVVAALVCGTSA
jgi:hypothetical protein